MPDSNQHSKYSDADLVGIALDELEQAAKGWPDDNVYERAHRAAVPALARLEEQLEAARNEVAREKARPGGSFDQWADYQRLSTTLAHAEDFIEHMDMSYRWAEWCEGRDPNPASEPRDESGYPGIQGLEAIARRKAEHNQDTERS